MKCRTLFQHQGPFQVQIWGHGEVPASPGAQPGDPAPVVILLIRFYGPPELVIVSNVPFTQDLAEEGVDVIGSEVGEERGLGAERLVFGVVHEDHDVTSAKLELGNVSEIGLRHFIQW